MAHRRESSFIVAMRSSPKHVPGNGEGACVSLGALFLPRAVFITLEPVLLSEKADSHNE